uniref:[histone H3]-lysine(4) N-trimethyltransferase n=1 Tax=Eptatretus burgeri TaxID=7764 RepID=A0A8C4REE8_EPTBU
TSSNLHLKFRVRVLGRKQHLSRCSKCRQARYCGTTCQRSDWTAHRLECPVLCAFGPSWTPPETVRLVARILTKQKTSTKKCPSEELFTIGELQSHLSDLNVEQKELIGQYIRILHKYYSKHVEFPGNEELIELFSKVNCNSFTIEDEELIHVGAALYPSLALLNHSCDFNCVVTFHGTTAEVHAVRDLLAGEELLITYIDLLYTSFDRIAQLRDLYFFTCTCKLCKTHHLDNEKLCIKQAGERPTEGEVNEMIKYSQAKIKEIREAKHVRSPEELLEMCKQCQTRQETVFAGGNVYNLHVEYQAMGAYLYLGQTKQALNLGLNLIKCYQTLYPPNSVNVAALWIKIGHLQRDLEKPIGAIDSFHKASLKH